MIDAISYTKVIARLMEQAKTSDEILTILQIALKDPKVAPQFSGRYCTSEINNSGLWYEGLFDAIKAATIRLLPEDRIPPHARAPESPDPGTIWRTPQGDTLIVVGSSKLGIVYCCPWIEEYFRMDFLQCLAVADFANLQSVKVSDLVLKKTSKKQSYRLKKTK